MRNTTTLTISLPEPMRQFIEGQVSAKGFGNVSEYFRSLVREAQEREERARLESLLLEGLTTGGEVEVTPEFWADLRAEAAQRLEKRRSG